MEFGLYWDCFRWGHPRLSHSGGRRNKSQIELIAPRKLSLPHQDTTFPNPEKLLSTCGSPLDGNTARERSPMASAPKSFLFLLVARRARKSVQILAAWFVSLQIVYAPVDSA